VKRVTPVSSVLSDRPVNKERRETEDCPDPKERLVARVIAALAEPLVLLGLQVPLVYRVHKVPRVQRVHPVLPVRRETLVCSDLPVLLARQER